MYKHLWDEDTGGFVLTTTNASAIGREIRPVYYKELDVLGFDKYWSYQKDDSLPLLWAELGRYYYKGREVAKSKGGKIYSQPKIEIYEKDLKLEPVKVSEMVKKNTHIMNSLVDDTLKNIRKTFLNYKDKVDIFYVAFSGGKDSIVLLDLVYRALPNDKFIVVFGDTDMELSSTYEAVEKTKAHYKDINIYTAKSHIPSDKSWYMFGPPSRVIRWCCGVHKSAPSILLTREICGKTNAKAFAFVGIRADESPRRSHYDYLGFGEKHKSQINYMPILKWGTPEVYNYIFEKKLFFNDAYKNGIGRVGCKICPMSSNRYEFFANKFYQKEIKDFLKTIIKTSVKDFNSKYDSDNFLEVGGWKARKNGEMLNSNKRRIYEEKFENQIKYRIYGFNSTWYQWIKILNPIKISDSEAFKIIFAQNKYVYKIEYEEDFVLITLYVKYNNSSKVFVKNFRRIINKTVYCKNCRVCEAECQFGAISFNPNVVIDTDKCKHCLMCNDIPNGCVVYNSLRLKKLRNIHEIARELGLPLSWLKQQAREGKIPSLRTGKKYWFELSAVKDALAEMAAEGRGSNESG